MGQDASGYDNGAYGLRLRPIDMQKFGVLFLNHVQFGNRSSVSLVNGLVWAKYSLTGNA